MRMRKPPGIAAAIRAEAKEQKAQADKAEALRIISCFARTPGSFNAARHTCSRAVGKLLIENGLTFAHGEGYYAKVKSLGCGVYHVTYEPKVYPSH